MGCQCPATSEKKSPASVRVCGQKCYTNGFAPRQVRTGAVIGVSRNSSVSGEKGY